MGIAGVDNVCYARCGLVFRKGRKTGDPSGKNGKVETDVKPTHYHYFPNLFSSVYPSLRPALITGTHINTHNVSKRFS